MADHDVSIKRFVEITGREDGVAVFYLRCSNWILDDALSNYFANQGDDDIKDSFARLKIEQQRGILVQEQTANSVESIQTVSKVTTLHGVIANNNNNDIEKVDVQIVHRDAGSSSSQQQQQQNVLEPTNFINIMKQIDQIFHAIQHRHNKNENMSDSQVQGPGAGMLLDITDNDPSMRSLDKMGENDVKGPLVVLKLWQPGFTLDDGELRPYEDPGNMEFLQAVMRGEVPEELLRMGWEVNMDVEDHRHEDYKRQKKLTPKNIKGSPQAIESSPSNTINPIANVTSQEINQTNQTNQTNQMTENNAKIGKKEFTLDISKPCTTIQIHLADGSCLIAQFNLSHTVADIQNFIRKVRPQYASKTFILVSTFPARELTDETLTIEATGLKNAALVQRFK